MKTGKATKYTQYLIYVDGHRAPNPGSWYRSRPAAIEAADDLKKKGFSDVKVQRRTHAADEPYKRVNVSLPSASTKRLLCPLCGSDKIAVSPRGIATCPKPCGNRWTPSAGALKSASEEQRKKGALHLELAVDGLSTAVRALVRWEDIHVHGPHQPGVDSGDMIDEWRSKVRYWEDQIALAS